MVGEVSDEDLMIMYRNGDSGAFELLYKRHKGGLYRYLLRKCNNQSIAEELFQEIWMKLIKARVNYVVRARFTTWFYRLAHNHTIDFYRRQNISVISKQPDENNTVEDIKARVQDQPEVRTDVQQQTEKLLQLVNQLPDEQREVFLLREEGGFNISEIAEITGVNAETAKSRLRYAVNKLRAGLENP
jgi:RNA polymerase sigma-70 factor, ECF subfamily